MGRLRTILALMCAIGVLVSAGWASATDIDELRERVNAARERIGELERDPASDVATREFSRCEIDIDEAADRIANRLEELAEIAVIRMENRLLLIEALIEQEMVNVLADERESAAIEMTRQADQSQVGYESTDARRQALRSEVEEIINSLEVEQ